MCKKKRKPKIFCLIITLVIAISIAAFFAVTSVTAITKNGDTDSANALYYLGLLKGTENGYRLEKTLTRAEAVTMIIRLSGSENAALACHEKHPFRDVPMWADRYVAYAYSEGITNGKSDTRFDPNSAVRDCEYLTLVLRMLGYTDSGRKPEFNWNSPYNIAFSLGLAGGTSPNADFLRGDAVSISFGLLDCKYKGLPDTVASVLIAAGIFNADDYKTAKKIAASETLITTTEKLTTGTTQTTSPTVTAKPTETVTVRPIVTTSPTLTVDSSRIDKNDGWSGIIVP